VEEKNRRAEGIVLLFFEFLQGEALDLARWVERIPALPKDIDVGWCMNHVESSITIGAGGVGGGLELLLPDQTLGWGIPVQSGRVFCENYVVRIKYCTENYLRLVILSCTMRNFAKFEDEDSNGLDFSRDSEVEGNERRIAFGRGIQEGEEGLGFLSSFSFHRGIQQRWRRLQSTGDDCMRLVRAKRDKRV
jgi:hypothetical protein